MPALVWRVDARRAGLGSEHLLSAKFNALLDDDVFGGDKTPLRRFFRTVSFNFELLGIGGIMKASLWRTSCKQKVALVAAAPKGLADLEIRVTKAVPVWR